ncbi:MAG: hypothetical protein IPJ34_38515 [Myxococcales bacterium]|nr:hypothetical protein [Myxococcales bacterium]
MDAPQFEASVGLTASVATGMNHCEKRNHLATGPSLGAVVRWGGRVTVGLGLRYRPMAYSGMNDSDCWSTINRHAILFTHEFDAHVDVDVDLGGHGPRLTLGPTWSLAINGDDVYFSQSPYYDASQLRRHGWFLGLGWRWALRPSLALVVDVALRRTADVGTDWPTTVALRVAL